MSNSIEQAFQKDGYHVIRHEILDSGALGYVAQSDTVINSVTGEQKKVFYVEGNGYDMGYLIGFMAPDDVISMTTKFIEGIVLDTLNLEDSNPLLKGLVKLVIKYFAKYAVESGLADFIPKPLIDEMNGLIDGVAASGARKKVKFEDVLILNAGFDLLSALALNPVKFIEENLVELTELGLHEDFLSRKKHLFKLNVLCNTFSACKNATASYSGSEKSHFFGREFQFPTGEVYQNVATMTIYKPTDGRHLLVSVGAPGFVGSITAMNKHGVVMGVDIAIGTATDSSHVGLNSLLLIRDTIHNAASAKEAVNWVYDAPRGVPWLYPIGEGATDEAGVMETVYNPEASESLKDFDPYDYVGPVLKLKKLVPSREYLQENCKVPLKNGMMVRWSDYEYPQQFINDFNPGLFKHSDMPYNPDDFGEVGYVFPTFKPIPDKYGPNYFPPQRETYTDVMLGTNNYLDPQMVLTSMNEYIAVITHHIWFDTQWRYDTLNETIRAQYGNIDFEKAWKIINFLSPAETGNTSYQEFYGSKEYKYDDGTKSTYEVSGATSALDLKAKVIRTLYGYYSDESLELNLMNYV